MQEIIKIENHNGKRVVSARELHKVLGVGKDFSSWIKERIIKYDFVEGQDFSSFTEIGERAVGATVRKEYALSIDMAKELSMIENNEKGRMVRKYFIECERRIHEPRQTSIIEDKMAAATWAAGFLNMNETSRLMLAKSILDPLGLPTPDYVQSHGVTHSASELLKSHGSSMSIVKFNARLVELGILRDASRQGSTKVHHFKVITDRGLEYGENQVSPKNPQQTQPRWYDTQFSRLLQMVQ